MRSQLLSSVSYAIFHPIESQSGCRIAKVLSLALFLFGVSYLSAAISPEVSSFFSEKEIIIFCSSTGGLSSLAYILLNQSHKKGKSLYSSQKSPYRRKERRSAPHSTLSVKAAHTSFSSSPSARQDFSSHLIALEEIRNILGEDIPRRKDLLAQEQEKVQQTNQKIESHQRLFTEQQSDYERRKRALNSDWQDLQERLKKMTSDYEALLPLSEVVMNDLSLTDKSSLPIEEGPPPLAAHPRCQKALRDVSKASDSPIKKSILALAAEIQKLEKEQRRIQEERFTVYYDFSIKINYLTLLEKRCKSQAFNIEKLKKLQETLNLINSLMIPVEKGDREIRDRSSRSCIGNILSSKAAPNLRQLDSSLIELMRHIESFNALAVEEEPSPAAPKSEPSTSPSFALLSGSISSSASALSLSSAESSPSFSAAQILEDMNQPILDIIDAVHQLAITITQLFLERPLKQEERDDLSDEFTECINEWKSLKKNLRLLAFIKSFYCQESKDWSIPTKSYLIELIYFAFNNKYFDKTRELLDLLKVVDSHTKKVNLLTIYQKISIELAEKRRRNRDSDPLYTLSQLLLNTMISIEGQEASSIDFDKELVTLRSLIRRSKDTSFLLKCVPKSVSTEPPGEAGLKFMHHSATFKGSISHRILYNIVANELIPTIMKIFKEKSLEEQFSIVLNILQLSQSFILRCTLKEYSYDHISERERMGNRTVDKEDQRAILLDHPESQSLRKEILQKCVYSIAPHTKLTHEIFKDGLACHLIPHDFFVNNIKIKFPPLGEIFFSSIGYLGWGAIKTAVFFGFPFISSRAKLFMNILIEISSNDSSFSKKFISSLKKASTRVQKDLHTLASKSNPELPKVCRIFYNFFAEINYELEN